MWFEVLIRSIAALTVLSVHSRLMFTSNFHTIDIFFMAKHVHMIVTMSFSLAWLLRFTPSQRVYLLSVLTLMVSSELVVELVRLFSFSNVVLSS